MNSTPRPRALRRTRTLIGTLMALLAFAGAGAVTARDATPSPLADPAAFSAVVDHPLVPLARIATRTFAGEERDPDTGETIELRVEETVLPDTLQVAGVDVTVVEVREYEDGELVEQTYDYYAQHRDGTVYYLGEAVDEIEDGTVVGHSGAWLAGEGQNQPGVFMPPEPTVGDTFEQERAPGIAEDRSTVVAIDLAATTPAGAFTGCVRTEDVDPIGDTTELKTYCPGVGLVREEAEQTLIELVAYAEAAATPGP